MISTNTYDSCSIIFILLLQKKALTLAQHYLHTVVQQQIRIFRKWLNLSILLLVGSP